MNELASSVQLLPTIRYLRSCSNFFWWKYLNFFGLMPYAFNRSSDIVGNFSLLCFFFFFFLFPFPLPAVPSEVLSAAVLDSCASTSSFFRFLSVVAVHGSSAAEVEVWMLQHDHVQHVNISKASFKPKQTNYCMFLVISNFKICVEFFIRYENLIQSTIIQEISTYAGWTLFINNSTQLN